MSVELNAIFHPSAVIAYKHFTNRDRSQDNKKSLSNLVKGAKGEYNGWMSPATARKCKKMINCFLILGKYGGRYTKGNVPTFCTLTLPSDQIHDDKFIKKDIFNDRFMKAIKRKFGVKHYFWRAEPQRNGRIHFHVIFDTKIPWQSIRGNWNHIISKYGYIDGYRKEQMAKHPKGKFKFEASEMKYENRQKQYKNSRSKLSFRDWLFERQKAAFDYGMKTNWNNPNSTDIRALKKIKNIGAYVCKYMTKTPKEVSEKLNIEAELKNGGYASKEAVKAAKKRLAFLEKSYRTIDGRIWGCSDSLRGLKYFEEWVEDLEWDNEAKVEFASDWNSEVQKYLGNLNDDPKITFKRVDKMISVWLLEKNQTQADAMKKHAPNLLKKYEQYYINESKILYP